MGEDDKNYSQDIQDRIRELAHSMWEWAGRQQDMALHYWLAAEKEVLATLRAATDKLMPEEKPEKAEESMAEAAKPAASEPPELAEVAVKPQAKQRPRSRRLRLPSEQEAERGRNRRRHIGFPAPGCSMIGRVIPRWCSPFE